jgi:hypothetical protein
MYLLRYKNRPAGDNTTEIKHRISQKKSYKCFKLYLVAQKYYKKQKNYIFIK